MEERYVKKRESKREDSVSCCKVSNNLECLWVIPLCAPCKPSNHCPPHSLYLSIYIYSLLILHVYNSLNTVYMDVYRKKKRKGRHYWSLKVWCIRSKGKIYFLHAWSQEISTFYYVNCLKYLHFVLHEIQHKKVKKTISNMKFESLNFYYLRSG